jgi:hypothetical protein
MTNGQQTLGVGLPCAIAACLVRPSEKVISISAMEGSHFQPWNSRLRFGSSATSFTLD